MRHAIPARGQARPDRAAAASPPARASPQPARARPEHRSRAHNPRFSALALQTKLKVGPINDPLEREADRMADQVMRMLDPEARRSASPALQHECTACHEHDRIKRQAADEGEVPVQTNRPNGADLFQRQPLQDEEEEVLTKPPQGSTALHLRSQLTDDEEEGVIRTKPSAETSGRSGSHGGNPASAVHSVLRSPGKPLDRDSRAFFEPRFGQDFADVRVHTDPVANQVSEALNARAFARGSDIYLGPGASTGDHRLMAHELTHVVQARCLDARGAPAAQTIRTDAKPTQRTGSGTAPKTVDPLASFPSLGTALNKDQLSQLQTAIRQREDIVQAWDVMLRYVKNHGINVFPPYGAGPGGMIDRMDAYHDRIRNLRLRPRPDDVVIKAIVLCDRDVSPAPGDPEPLKAAKQRIVKKLEETDVTIFVPDRYALDAAPTSIRIHMLGYDITATKGRIKFENIRRLPAFASIITEEEARHIREGRVKAATPLMEKLERLSVAARSEGVRGVEFANSIDEFRKELGRRIDTAKTDEPMPPDIQMILNALILWSSDPGNKWGEGSWDSKDLQMSAPEYAMVPASQYKCNAYIAEIIYKSMNIIQLAYSSDEQIGRYFPYRAADWANAKVTITGFNIVPNPMMGDIWSTGSHVGIYLGEYDGRGIYISARDDGDGVFALNKEQKEHGVQIKFMKSGGVYRRYTK